MYEEILVGITSGVVRAVEEVPVVGVEVEEEEA